MIIINFTVLCCLFAFIRDNIESNAFIYYPQDNKFSLSDRNNYRNKESIRYFNKNPRKKPSVRQYVKTQRPMRISFGPFGSIEMSSLFKGQIEINTEAFAEFFNTINSKTISQISNLYDYLSPYADNSEKSADISEMKFNSEQHRQSEEDNSKEEIDASQNSSNDLTSRSTSPSENEDESNYNQQQHSENKSEIISNRLERSDSPETTGHNHQTDTSDRKNHSNPNEQTEDKSTYSNHDNIEYKSDEKSKESSNSENTSRFKHSKEDVKNSNENSSQNTDQSKTAKKALIRGVRAFQKYYPYARPMVNAASFFFPVVGQYQQLKFALEMADLAHQTASMYTEGEGASSIGWYLGKEAFYRLGRRDEDNMLNELTDNKPPVNFIDTQSMNVTDFLKVVENTKYPLLKEEQENQLKQKVFEIADKYFHEEETFKNDLKRTQFIDIMTLCVKFIALNEIISSITGIKLD